MSAAGAFAQAPIAPFGAFEISVAGMGCAVEPFLAANDNHHITTFANGAGESLSLIFSRERMLSSETTAAAEGDEAAVASALTDAACDHAEAEGEAVLSHAERSSFETASARATDLFRIIASIGRRFSLSIASRSLDEGIAFDAKDDALESEQPAEHSLRAERPSASGGEARVFSANAPTAATADGARALAAAASVSSSPVAATSNMHGHETAAERALPEDGSATRTVEPDAHTMSAASRTGTPNASDVRERVHATSSHIFAGASDIIGELIHLSLSSAAIRDVLIALRPMAAAGTARPASEPVAAPRKSERLLSVRRTPDGSVLIALVRESDGGSLTMRFEQSDGAMHFAGVSFETLAPMHDPMAVAPLPVPTYFPGGGISDGVIAAPITSGGGASTGFTDEQELRLDLENMLADVVLEQLRLGPEPKVAARLSRQLNAYLRENDHTDKAREITPARWKRMMRNAILLTARSVPLYDEKGVRTTLAIQKDLIAVAGMDMNTLLAWERHLGIDVIEEAVFLEEGDDGMTRRMTAGLGKRLSALAKLRLKPSFIEPALGIEGEANLQWGLASVSRIDDSTKKIAAALDYLRAVHAVNKNAACKGVALILKHANLAGRKKPSDRLVPRWSETEVTSLIKEVMLSELWEIMGHRALRSNFEGDSQMNAFINEAIFSANYAKAMRDLERIDVTEVPEEEFWRAVEDTGVEEIILENIYARMGNHR